MSGRPAEELRSFITAIEGRGELARIAVAVDPVLEIAAITDRVSKALGPALWFSRPTGYVAPVLTNLFGTPQRAALAVADDGDLHGMASRLRLLLDAAGNGTASERLLRLCPLAPAPLATPCWDEQTGHLAEIPALQVWPGDAGRYLSLPLIVTRDPESGQLNWGLYRVQLLDHGRALLHLRPGAGAAAHLAAWRRRGEPMPVAIVLGAPPALLWAASAPWPEGLDEAALLGVLRGRPLPLAACRTSDLLVPAQAEAVIEGVVDPQATLPEGPFGNHTGSYVAASPAPLVRVLALRRRHDMLYPCTVVGRPPMENCWLAKVNETLLLPLLQCDVPQVTALHLPLEGIFHGCALVAAETVGEGRALLAALRRTPLLRSARLLVLCAADTDVHNPGEVFWRTINRVRPERDLLVDAAGLAIDASHLPAHPLQHDAGTSALLARRWQEYGLSDFQSK